MLCLARNRQAAAPRDVGSMITEKNLDRIDKALISTRKRLIKCVENGQPATVTVEILLKTGGSVAAAMVSVKEHVSMQDDGK